MIEEKNVENAAFGGEIGKRDCIGKMMSDIEKVNRMGFVEH